MDWRSFWSLVATSVSKRIRLDSIGRGNRGKKTKKKKKVAGRKGARRKGGESSELPVVGRYAYSTCAFLRPLTRKTSKSLSSGPRVNRVADSPVRNPTRDRLYRATFSPQEKHAVRSLPPPLPLPAACFSGEPGAAGPVNASTPDRNVTTDWPSYRSHPFQPTLKKTAK